MSSRFSEGPYLKIQGGEEQRKPPESHPLSTPTCTHVHTLTETEVLWVLPLDFVWESGAPWAGRCGVDSYRALLFRFHTRPSHPLRLLSSEECVQQSRVSPRSLSGSAVYIHTHTPTPFLVPMPVSEDNQVQSGCMRSRPGNWCGALHNILISYTTLNIQQGGKLVCAQSWLLPAAWCGWTCPKILPILIERKSFKFLSYKRKHRQDHIYI